MKETGKRRILLGIIFIAVFAILTWLVQVIDVEPIGVNRTNIGFSTLNCYFHKLCGVNMTLYTITDWAGLVPIFVAFSFGVVGVVQLIKRKSLAKVDTDILILGIYYIIVMVLYVVFDMIPINYRPILINGLPETSYPSSTTLLVLCVMPTLIEQISRRCNKSTVKTAITVLTVGFSAFMVVGRLLSGVHWFTDILGSVIISTGLFYIYKGIILMLNKKL